MSFQTVDPDRNPAESGSSGPSLKLIALLLVVIAMGIFVFQNDERAQVEFLWLDVSWPVSLVIGISVVAGILIDRLGTWSWRRARRRRAVDES